MAQPSIRRHRKEALCALRNLNSIEEVMELGHEPTAALSQILADLSTYASHKGAQLWDDNKAPMAVYWRTSADWFAVASSILRRKLPSTLRSRYPQNHTGRHQHPVSRSDATIRNPALNLHSTALLQALSVEDRARCKQALRALYREARAQSLTAWKDRDDTNAVLFKVASVWALHLAHACIERPSLEFAKAA